jgi:tetratricopeptide (TPR) repeat protein
MSPEQARGDLEHLGPRSDVYSLGATLYCLLTGKSPVEGDDIGEVLRAVQRGQFPPPRQVDATIDRALEAVCLKAMALKPGDRYATPKALAEDVERWMADEPVTAWREPWTRPLLRWLTRHRVGVTAIGAALLVALAGTAAVLAVQTQANRKLRSANLELAAAHNSVTRANAELAASNQRERARFALAQDAIRTFHTGVSKDVLLKEEEFKALRTKLLREAREFYRKLEDHLQGQPDRESRLSLGRAYYEVGELTRELDSIEEAEAVLRRGLALFDTLSGENPADAEVQRAFAFCLRELGVTLTGVGRHDEALESKRRSRDLFRTLAQADPAERALRYEWAHAEMLVGMALVLSNHPPAEVLEATERAQAILEAKVGDGPQSPDFQSNLRDLYGALGYALEAVGRGDEALAAYRRAQDLSETLFRTNPNDPEAGHELARNLGNMGIHLASVSRDAEALAAYGRALEVLTVARNANRTLVRLPAASAWIESLAAATLVKLGRNDEALAALGRAWEAREMLIKANPPVTRNREQFMWIVRQTVDIYRSTKRMSEAAAALERARQFLASLVKSHPQIPEYRADLAARSNDLGGIYEAMGKLTEARESFDAAIATYGDLVESGPANASHRYELARGFRHRGVVMQKLGRPSDAVGDFRQSITKLKELAVPSPLSLYDLACAQSSLAGVSLEAGSGLSTVEGQAAAEAAMATLRRARGAGWHGLAELRSDPSLAPLRSRPDFQLLLMDLAFPPWPFEGDPPLEAVRGHDDP